MSDENKGGAPKKLGTKDILAAARAQTGKAAAPAPAASTGAPTPEPAAPETPAAATPAPAKPAGGAKPKSTADILAAARAQSKPADAGAGGASPAAAPKAAPPAAAGAKPKGTSDILAAARAAAAAKAAGGAPAAAPAGATPAPKAKPAAAAAASAEEAGGPKLSVEEMLAAVRPAGAAPTIVAKPAAPAGAPPMPAKPVPAAKKKGAETEVRRNVLVALLLSPFALAWALMTATTAIASLAVARFMMPNVLTEPPRKFKVGPPTDFDLGTVATKLVAQYGIWIVHTDQYKGKNLIYALASVCTHLGCTPSWLEGEQKFKCPCHGSGFYITGINFEGPAPRPLERMGIRLAPDGMLEVDKSLKFQEEMGQWSDPASFFEVIG